MALSPAWVILQLLGILRLRRRGPLPSSLGPLASATFPFIVCYDYKFVVIIERRGHKESTEQSRSAERTELTEEAESKAKSRMNRKTIGIQYR